MSDFNFTLEDLADSSAMARKTADTFYANGQPLRTSYSKSGDPSRTLTQRDLQSVLGGDALYRSPNFALQLSQKNTESSISGILAANPGTDASGIKIKDPNSTNPNAELTGSAAFSQIVASSSLGKQGLGYNIPNVLSQLGENNNNSEHSNTTGPFDPTKEAMGASRPVTYVDQLSAEEKTVFDQRIKEVVSAGIVSDSSKLAFTFSSAGSEKIGATWKVYLTASQGVNNNNNPILNTNLTSFSAANGKMAYTCASMIELLLSLGSGGSGIYLRGNIGVTNGFTGVVETEASDKGGVDDHTFGRAFDITSIGKTVSDQYNLSSSNVDTYKGALDVLLSKLNTIPEFLHPDLIVIHPDLAVEYGIGRGFESTFSNNNGVDSKGISITNAGFINKKYKNLTRINFDTDSGHTKFIHMSFGPARAGSYQGWLDAGSDAGDPSGGDVTAGTTPAGDPNDLTELGESFATKTTALKNTNALYRALVNHGGYTPEAAAILMCIAERESNFGPGAFNGKVNGSSGKPPGTGDYSIGLFQINFAGSDKYLNNQITVASIVNGKIVKEQIQGYKLIDKDYAANKVNNATTAKAKMKEWYKVDPKKPDGQGISEGKSHSDPRMWNAITQISFALIMTTQKKNGWMFWNWGEYDTDGKRPAAGWLRFLKFQTAINFYTANNPGKTAQDLKNWMRKNVDRNLVSSKEYLNLWLQGYVFDDSYGTAKILKDRSSNTADDVPTFTKTDIREAAIWLRDNRMTPWEKKNSNKAFGCEGFANRLSAALGLFGPAKPEIFTEKWTGTTTAAVPTNLRTSTSATAHYNTVKDSGYFSLPGTANGDNPPAGHLVFWTGGSGQDSLNGHVGISLGNGSWIDQNGETPRKLEGSTAPGGFPGTKYVYVGSSARW
jgi:hypothetical protein